MILNSIKRIDEKAIEDNRRLFNKVSNRIRRFLLLDEEVKKVTQLNTEEKIHDKVVKVQ